MSLRQLMIRAKDEAPAAYQDMSWALQWNMTTEEEAREFLEKALEVCAK